jgi:hypothetical protein
VRWYVGRIFTEQMVQGEHRRWSITGHFIKTMPSAGFTDTLDDAKREFATAWRAWLAKTGKDEETHRPFYGTPMSGTSAPGFAFRQRYGTMAVPRRAPVGPKALAQCPGRPARRPVRIKR